MTTTTDDKPRPYTEEEIRAAFLSHVRAMVRYWSTQAGTSREQCEGLAFSILSTLDGNAAMLPGFRVIADPHPTDQAYHEGEGENWYPPASEGVDIAGGLHEQLGRC